MIVLNPIVEARKAAQRERYRKWRSTAAGRESALAHKRRWDENNAEHRRAYRRRYTLENAPQIRFANRQRYNAPGKSEKRREIALWTNYRLTVAEYEAILDRQGGICPICLTEKAVHVDHCHATGVVRGILCAHCNKGLGCFRDKTERMVRACEYLRAVPATGRSADINQ